MRLHCSSLVDVAHGACCRVGDADSERWTDVPATGDIPCARSTHSVLSPYVFRDESTVIVLIVRIRGCSSVVLWMSQLTPINDGKQLLLFGGYKGGVHFETAMPHLLNWVSVNRPRGTV